MFVVAEQPYSPPAAPCLAQADRARLEAAKPDKQTPPVHVTGSNPKEERPFDNKIAAAESPLAQNRRFLARNRRAIGGIL